MGKGFLWIIVPFCSIFILIGAGLMTSSLLQVVEGTRASAWPAAVGTIKTAELKQHRAKKGHTTELKVTYAYTVDGREYVGDVIHPCYAATSHDPDHAKLAELLRPGTQVRVRYRPDAPQRSCLATGLFTGSLIGVLGGGLFAAVGTLFLLIFCSIILGNWDFGAGIVFVDPPR